MFKIITSYLGISSFNYYDMTPRETALMLEGYHERHKSDIEFMAIANKIAIINAMAKKNYKVFPGKQKEINANEKEKTLEELEKLFS